MKETFNFLQRIVFVSLFFFFSFNAVFAQISVPYFEGFEDAVLDGTWTFVNGKSVNEWYIGSADAAEGSRGLYVSGDGGNTTTYQNIATGVGVYKWFDLPEEHDFYQISFDWKQGGETASNGTPLDNFYVLWVSNPDVNITNSTGELPKGLTSYVASFENNDFMQGPEFWHHATIRIRSTNGRLVFYWINNSSNSNPPAICIDNIQIYPVGDNVSCKQPTDLQIVQDRGTMFSWQGNSDVYQLRYKNETTGVWIDVEENISESSYTLHGLDKGFYTFWLRGVCGTDTTAWGVYSNYLQVVLNDKCFNYTNLTDSNVTPAFGNYGDKTTTHVGLIDFGYESNRSRHTIHYRQDEYDPRSGGKLKTVPDGEVASVRLGNWHGGSESESLTYTFTVDRKNTILLVKYAVLLQFHSVDVPYFLKPPRFIIKLTDSHGEPLDEMCLSIDYTSSENLENSGWSINESYPSTGSGSPVVWKDWTTMGMNLSDYAGKTVKLYLETSDCGPVPDPDGACFSYAYFTLDCTPADIQGLTCGASTEKAEIFCAPSGFSYAWYNIDSPSVVLSDEQCFKPKASDMNIYKCRMTSVEPGKESCYFELTATLLPRYPKADADYIVQRRKVQLFDKSYVETQTGKIDETCSIYWDLGDSISYERNPVHEFFAPGKYEVKLYASLNNGECEEVWMDSVTVSNAPKALLITPGNGANDVAVDADISIKFDVDIEIADVSKITISPMVSGMNVTLIDSILTITHDDFAYNTSYTITFAKGALGSVEDRDNIGKSEVMYSNRVYTKSTVAENNDALNNEISWSFTTEEDRTGFAGANFQHVQLQPNPAKTQVMLTGLAGNTKVVLFDLSGKTIQEYQANYELNINIDFESGTYFVRIENNGQSVVKKLLVR